VKTRRVPSRSGLNSTGTFVHESVEDAVRSARTAAGDRNVGILGAGVAKQCLDAGLLDEIVVQVAPVLLGDGVRLFDRAGSHQIKLEKTRVAESGQLTDLRFRVLK
jgi:dihydrofolate reductase